MSGLFWAVGVAGVTIAGLADPGEWTAPGPNTDPGRPYIGSFQVISPTANPVVKLTGTWPTNLTGVTKVQVSDDLVTWTALQSTAVLSNQWGGGTLAFDSSTLPGPARAALDKSTVLLRAVLTQTTPEEIPLQIKVIVPAIPPRSSWNPRILDLGEGAPPICGLLMNFPTNITSGTLNVTITITNEVAVTRNYEFPNVKSGDTIYNLGLDPAFYLPSTNDLYMYIRYKP